jgi:ABC-type multidrug transport system fused ATPase/permease subunit
MATGAKLLVIDEGLSGLDPVTEATVLRNIRRRFGLILVTHRLGSIVDFDRIIVMDGGRIVGDGPHAQLLQNCRQYKLLVENSKSAENAA